MALDRFFDCEILVYCASLWGGQELLLGADSQQMAKEARVVEVELGGLGKTFAQIGMIWLQ
jgi:hypothetical protein